jgi:tetratricopeptide (TPR) repeat protein
MAKQADGRALRRLAGQFRIWLKTERKPEVLDALLALSDDELSDFAFDQPDCVATSTVRALIDRSYEKRGNNPPLMITLGRLATRVAEMAWLIYHDDDLVRGDAWRQYSAALAGSGEYYAASEACEVAEALYLPVTSHDPAYQRALLALTRGHALYYLGRAEEALLLIDEAARVLRPLNKSKYVTARTTYAAFLLESGSIKAAAAIFLETETLAREVGDSEAVAYIIGNIGGCYARLGMLPQAREYIGRAIKEYERLGLKTYVLNRRRNLVRVLIQEGKFNLAVAELFDIRRAFLELGMPVVAADTGLWLVDVLYLANRTSQVPSLCEELIKVFRDKKLPDEAAKALAYLNSSMTRGVQRSDVRFVREFMTSLEANAGAVFNPPSPMGPAD